MISICEAHALSMHNHDRLAMSLLTKHTNQCQLCKRIGPCVNLNERFVHDALREQEREYYKQTGKHVDLIGLMS